MSWTFAQLNDLLNQHQDWTIRTEGNCLCVTNDKGLDTYVAISGEQVVVESILFSKSQVSDSVALNTTILKTHQVFPLTTIGIRNVEGQDYYIAFGSLSSQSKPESIVIEIEALFENVPRFLDAYEAYIN